jgi:hypothetical protein
MKMLIDNKHIQIILDSANHCIEYHWKVKSTLRDFKEMMNKLCYFVHIYNCNKLIPDLDDFSTASDEVRNWTQSEWFPNLVRNGITTFIIINPYSESIIKSINDSEEFISNLRNNTTIRTFYFNDIDSARDWLTLNKS